MPVLAGMIGALFAGLFDFLVTYFSRTVALKLAFGAMITAAFGVLMVSLNLAVSALAYTMPEGLVVAFQFVFPGNVVTCAAAAIAADAVIAGFRLFVSGVKI